MNFTHILKKITTLHGTRQVIIKTGLQLYIWIAILFANILLTIGYILVIKTRFNNDQIITRINANCKVNQMPFPAVSICNFNVVSLKQTAEISKILFYLGRNILYIDFAFLLHYYTYTRENDNYDLLKSNLNRFYSYTIYNSRKTYNQTTQEIELFYKNLPFLTNFGKMKDKIGNFSGIMEILKKHYFSIDTLMEEVHQKCEDLLLYCEFNRKTKNCEDLFNLIKTYEGYCCAFNYAALKDVNVDGLSNDEDTEYYIDSSTQEKMNSILVTTESGRGSGLSVLLNVEPQDYPDWSLSPYYGAKILITDPNDYPEITVSYKYVKVGQSLDIKVEPKIFQSEDGLRSVPVDKRGCAFHDETILEYTDRYSSETCKTECKMKRYKEECGCIPYKYPIEASSRICSFEDLECLNNLRVYRNDENRTCKPVCYIECRDKKYSISSDIMPFFTEFYTDFNKVNQNRSDLSSLQVYFAKSTCSCYKKMLFIDFNYIIATYGGIFSLSFGASIITLIEFIYLLLSLFVKTVLRLHKKLN